MNKHLCRKFKTLVLSGLVWALLWDGVIASEQLPALRVIQSGHSLTDGLIEPLTIMVRANSILGGTLDKATIPGSTMEWRWQKARDTDPKWADIMADYDVLAITERVALTTTMSYHDSKRWALHWASHAWKYGADGNGARTVLYASWVSIESGPRYKNTNKDPEGHLSFSERLPLEMTRWQSILEYVNVNRPDGMPKMEIIPGPLIMARAYEDIEAGAAPGLNDIRDLFKDDIHTNPKGAYLMALAHFAVIYGGNLRDLPKGMLLMQGGPSRDQVEWMQGLVSDVLAEYAARELKS